MEHYIPDLRAVPDAAEPAPHAEEVVVSRFTDKMFHNARISTKGMVTGEPHEPVRHTWGEVHERARRIAGGLEAAGVGLGDAVGVLAGAPVEIAPTAQALWMRGASLTMLHQPTPRTDLELWAKDTANVIDMIEAKAYMDPANFPQRIVKIPVCHGNFRETSARNKVVATSALSFTDPRIVRGSRTRQETLRQR